MFWQLAQIFFNVIVPVFALVLLGYAASTRLGLHAQSLSRFAYYLLVPAFVFSVVSTAEVSAQAAAQMVLFAVLVHVANAALAFGVARWRGCSPKMIGAYMLIAVFGNVGNFGLPVIEFHLGKEALVAATIYFLTINIVGFILGVGSATMMNAARVGMRGPLLAVLRTPALLAVVPALLVNVSDVTPPLVITRVATLLAGGMVPTMLVALGAQLAHTPHIRVSRDVVLASSVRLVGAPVLAILLATLWGVGGMERAAGILQAGMPAAVLTSIIALEYDLMPTFVTTTVLFSTLASVVTLTVLIAFL